MAIAPAAGQISPTKMLGRLKNFCMLRKKLSSPPT